MKCRHWMLHWWNQKGVIDVVMKDNKSVSDYTQFKYFMLLYSYEKIIIEASSLKFRRLNFRILTIQLFLNSTIVKWTDKYWAYWTSFYRRGWLSNSKIISFLHQLILSLFTVQMMIYGAAQHCSHMVGVADISRKKKTATFCGPIVRENLGLYCM